MQLNDSSWPTSQSFLMAEDNIADEELIKEMIRQGIGAESSVQCVTRFEHIITALQQTKFDALILDLNLPDQSGVDNVSAIAHRFPELPIVVLTGHDNLALAVDALQKGAQDYLSKNTVTPDILARSLRYAKERKQIELQLKLALDESAQRNSQLESLAKTDALTQLPNRAYFHEVASRMLHRANRLSKYVALLYFDLNSFKKVNDTYGHLVGDKLLIQIAERLMKTTRGSDFLARLSGDEFVVLTEVLSHKAEAKPLVERILQAFSEPFDIDSHQIISLPSIGVAYFPEAENIDLLIKHADCAMYQAKANDKTNVCFYSDEMAQQFSRAHQIELQLSQALTHNEFYANFQPVQSLIDPQAIAIEALIRWQSPSLGMVTPDEFIPLAEHTPAINDMTRKMIYQCGQWYQQIKQLNLHQNIDKIAINICASQLYSDHFCDLFSMWINEVQLPAEQICLELTERQVVQTVSICQQQFQRLRKLGVKIALDDFGSGYSSFSHLLDLDIDILKLDRILTDHIDQQANHRALAAGIIEMAHRMSMKVVAEGIEREQEYQVMQQLGCDYIQGYYFSKPLSLEHCSLFFSDSSEY